MRWFIKYVSSNALLFQWMVIMDYGVHGATATKLAVVVNEFVHVPVPTLLLNLEAGIAPRLDPRIKQKFVIWTNALVSLETCIALCIYSLLTVKSKYNYKDFLLNCQRLLSLSTVHGNYSNWSLWSPCSVTCGVGTVERRRYCTNPPPSLGGRSCAEEGPETEKKSCELVECTGKDEFTL